MSTRALKEVFLRDRERRLLSLAILLSYFAKSTHSHETPDLYTVNPQGSSYKPRCTSWTQTITSNHWLGISMLMPQTHIILSMLKKLCFPSPKLSSCVSISVNIQNHPPMFSGSKFRTLLLPHSYPWTKSEFSVLSPKLIKHPENQYACLHCIYLSIFPKNVTKVTFLHIFLSCLRNISALRP